MLAKSRGVGRLVELFLDELGQGNLMAWLFLIGLIVVGGVTGGVTAYKRRQRRLVLEELAQERAARPKQPPKAKRSAKQEPTPAQQALREKAPKARPGPRFEWAEGE